MGRTTDRDYLINGTSIDYTCDIAGRLTSIENTTRGYLGTSVSKPLPRISGAHLDSIKTGPEFESVVMLKEE